MTKDRSEALLDMLNKHQLHQQNQEPRLNGQKVKNSGTKLKID